MGSSAKGYLDDESSANSGRVVLRLRDVEDGALANWACRDCLQDAQTNDENDFIVLLLPGCVA